MNDESSFAWCSKCQRVRRQIDVVPQPTDFFAWATVGMLHVVLFLVREIALPRRCDTCFAAIRLFSSNAYAEEQDRNMMNSLLNSFDKDPIDYFVSRDDEPEKDYISTLVVENGYYFDSLKKSGYGVGGSKETILHVSPILPEFAIDGYIARFFLVLFFPVFILGYLYRKSKNDKAGFFPVDHYRAGRAILTTERIAFVNVVSPHYYSLRSIPLHLIREVRQLRTSARVQLHDTHKSAIDIRIGENIGRLLKSIYYHRSARVRYADRDWSQESEGN